MKITNKMITKGITITTKIIFAAALIGLSACKNDIDNTAINGNKINTTIEIVEQEYQSTSPVTRAVINNSSIQNSELVGDLTDCSAYSDVVPNLSETQSASTRALSKPTHYTVRFYLGSTKAGELKGTLNGSTFTADPSTPNKLILERGKTYTFICFNDDVVTNGETLEVSLNKAATARIGRSTFTTTTTKEGQKVQLVAKHAGVKVRTQILAQKHHLEPFKAKFLSNSTEIPNKVAYDPISGTYTTISTAALAEVTNDSPKSNEKIYEASNYGKNYSYTSSGPWHYLLPGTNAKHLKLNISDGKIFWNKIQGTINNLVKTDELLTANGTYTIQVKMKPNFTYLFSDGTTGTLPKNPSKKPIAVVIEPDKHIAAAIKEAGDGAVYKWSTAIYNSVYTNIYNPSEGDGTAQNYIPNNVTGGYSETWDPNYSTNIVTDNKVKGENPNFPAFYAAAHFNPGVPLGPSLINRQWFLPTQYEYFFAYEYIGFSHNAMTTKALNSPRYYYGYLYEAAFVAAGGRAFLANGIENYWTSTSHNGGGRSVPTKSYAGSPSNYRYYEYKVRAFITY